MKNGNGLVDRIDEILKRKNLKRQALCDAVGISLQGITNWKKQNSMPSADTAIKIAQYLGVSVEWLICEEIPNDKDDPCSSWNIVYRIENLLTEITGFHDYEANELMYRPLAGIVSSETLSDWKCGRVIPPLSDLRKIAEKLKVQFQFLVTGVQVLDSDYDSHTCELAKQYDSFIKSYDCLYESDQKTISSLVFRFFKLRRQIEGTDYDFNRQPGDPWNKQASPD